MSTKPQLSPRQAEIVRLIAGGKTDKEIAELLKLSPATVKTHLRAAFGRLGARTRAQAVMRFLEKD